MKTQYYAGYDISLVTTGSLLIMAVGEYRKYPYSKPYRFDVVTVDRSLDSVQVIRNSNPFLLQDCYRMSLSQYLYIWSLYRDDIIRCYKVLSR